MSQTHLYPPGYAHWLAERMPETISESLTTCEACAMVKPVGLTRDPGPFEPGLKCCTYFPFIPNFGVGGILNDSGEAGRVRLATARRQGILLPFGLFASPEREAQAKKAGRKGFGRKANLLCPFFDSVANGCSVWQNRPGVCTTYFCKSERGAEGLEFWGEVEGFLNQFEWALANEVAKRLGFGEELSEICEAVFIEDSGPDRELAIQGAWGSWLGKEEEFFRRSRVEALAVSAADLDSIFEVDL